MTSQKKFGPIFACFYPFFHVKLRAQVQDLQKREFYDLPEHGAATTKARGGLGTIQTSWARRAIKIMAVDSCELLSAANNIFLMALETRVFNLRYATFHILQCSSVLHVLGSSR